MPRQTFRGMIRMPEFTWRIYSQFLSEMQSIDSKEEAGGFGSRVSGFGGLTPPVPKGVAKTVRRGMIKRRGEDFCLTAHPVLDEMINTEEIGDALPRERWVRTARKTGLLSKRTSKKGRRER